MISLSLDVAVDDAQHCVMKYAAPMREKLVSEGYMIEEEQSGDLFRVRAEKDGRVFISTAENKTVAYLEVVSMIRSKGALDTGSYQSGSFTPLTGKP